MLVLTRKPGQVIDVGGLVTLTVLEVRSGRAVRLGINAPANLIVRRLPADPAPMMRARPLREAIDSAMDSLEEVRHFDVDNDDENRVQMLLDVINETYGRLLAAVEKTEGKEQVDAGNPQNTSQCIRRPRPLFD